MAFPSRSHSRRPSSSVVPSSSKQPNLDFLTVPQPHPYPNLRQNPSTSGETDGENPGFGAATGPVTGRSPPPITPAPEGIYLFNSSDLSSQEVLRRRSHNLKQLARVYRDHYWAMMEELKAKHREYVWKYGLSPFKEDELRQIAQEEAADVGVKGSGGMGLEVSMPCAFDGCTLKAMALTRFCRLHILSDSKQVLYKPCEYVIKRQDQ